MGFNKDVCVTKIKSDAPLSETLIPKKSKGTKAECIADLRKLAMNNPELSITRNYYRVHGNYAESVWSAWAGTFAEFKRQAGLVLTRQQHAVERNVAKHASVDHYREMELQREEYEGKYLREDNSRYKTILAASDLHDVEIDPFFNRVLQDTAKRLQPDVICLAGDVFDLPEFGKYTVDPREWDVVGRIKFAHENILAPLRESSPSAQIDLIEGNHECVTPDTEILTTDGWLSAKDVSIDTKIASFDINTKAVSYEKPLAVATVFDAESGSVIGFHKHEVVSLNHNLIVNNELMAFGVAANCNLQATDFCLALNNESDVSFISQSWLAMITWVLSKGFVTEDKTDNRRVQFKNLPFIQAKHLRFIAKEAKVKFDRTGNIHYLDFDASQWDKLTELLEVDKYAGGYTPRNWPAWVQNLNSTYVKILFNELKWVCQKLNGNSVHHYVFGHDSADRLQLAFVMCGYSAIVRKYANQKAILVARLVSEIPNRLKKVNFKYVGKRNLVAIQSKDGTLITRLNGVVNFTGNCRLIKHLADSSPAMRAVLSDLHGMTLGQLFALDKYEINYVAKSSLAAYSKAEHLREVGNNYKVYFDAVMAHHFPHARSFGLPGFNGHHHCHQVWPMFNATYGAYEWHQMGAGHRRSASYCEGEKWHTGFLIIHVDTLTKKAVFEYVQITDFTIVGGKYYYREPHELIHEAL